MPEKKVPQSDMPGEKTSATQPFPSAPPPYSRTYVAESDIVDFTPQLKAQALENLKKFRWEQTPFVPPVLTGPGQKYLGTINIANTAGGVNWPGSGFDPETGIFYTQAGNSAVTIGAYGPEEFEDVRADHQAKMSPSGRLPRWEADPNYGLQAARPRPAPGAPGAGPPVTSGRQALAQGLDGLPIVKPPYGVVAAIDLNKGTLLFQVPHGDTPDNVRNHAALKGMNIPKTGQSGSVGVLVTKTLIVVGDPQVTTPQGRSRGAMLRAYNKTTGEQVGEVLMPAAISGSPMTYSIDGKQYIIVAVSGGNYTGEYIAYRLPNKAE
jgi:quinoprotein glucose dehydrogenase